jgi:hypothetical protein
MSYNEIPFSEVLRQEEEGKRLRKQYKEMHNLLEEILDWAIGNRHMKDCEFVRCYIDSAAMPEWRSKAELMSKSLEILSKE